MEEEKVLLESTVAVQKDIMDNEKAEKFISEWEMFDANQIKVKYSFFNLQVITKFSNKTNNFLAIFAILKKNPKLQLMKELEEVKKEREIEEKNLEEVISQKESTVLESLLANVPEKFSGEESQISKESKVAMGNPQIPLYQENFKSSQYQERDLILPLKALFWGVTKTTLQNVKRRF